MNAKNDCGSAFPVDPGAWNTRTDTTRLSELEAEVARLRSHLEDIDAVGCDFGHYEAAARTMKEIASKALGFLK